MYEYLLALLYQVDIHIHIDLMVLKHINVNNSMFHMDLILKKTKSFLFFIIIFLSNLIEFVLMDDKFLQIKVILNDQLKVLILHDQIYQLYKANDYLD